MTFLNGRRDYIEGFPCPTKPSEETCNSNAAGAYYGWMLARARDVEKIFAVLSLCGLRDTKQGDKLTRELCGALDKKHGFKRTNKLR